MSVGMKPYYFRLFVNTAMDHGTLMGEVAKILGVGVMLYGRTRSE